jgi:glycosyltransferase involved in cell wall biosynthesis
MKWSIIIPTYEKEKFTISCLKDLSKLSLLNHEIIIVDNSFTENTRLALEELNMPNVKYNRSDINTFSHACNLGYKKCFGENILFLNNDIKVQNYIEWTDLLLNTINENEYVITGPTGGYLDEKTFDFKYETRESSKKINYISGWCLAANRKTFYHLEEDEVLFSELFKFYFEDADLGWTAQKKGVMLKLTDVPLTHFGKISTDKTKISHLYLNGKKIFTEKWKNK